jgi:hypothetical protein
MVPIADRKWLAVNARVKSATSYGVLLGVVEPEPLPTSTVMEGSLKLNNTTSRTELDIRARLNRLDGNLAIGFEDASGDRILAGLRGHATNPHELFVAKKSGTLTTYLVAVPVAQNGPIEVRLEFKLSPRCAVVYVDGAIATDCICAGPTETCPEIDLSTGGKSYFRGWHEGEMEIYKQGDGEIDNFEATVLCTNPAPSCPS